MGRRKAGLSSATRKPPENDKEAGFTLGETLLAVTISLFVSVSACMAYSAMSSGFAGSAKVFSKACSLATADRAIRKRIRDFRIPYWSDGVAEFEEFRGSLMEKNICGAAVLSCSLVEYRDGWAGVKCLYTLSGIEGALCVEERIGGVSVLGSME